MRIIPKTAYEAMQTFMDSPAADTRAFRALGERESHAVPYFASYVVSNELKRVKDEGHLRLVRDALRVRGRLATIETVQYPEFQTAALLAGLELTMKPQEGVHAWVFDEDHDALLAAGSVALQRGFAVVTNTGISEQGLLMVAEDAVLAYKPQETLSGVLYHGNSPDQIHGLAKAEALNDFQTTDSFVVV